MSDLNPEIEESWRVALKDEFNSSSFNELKLFLKEEKRTKIVYPLGSDIFTAFNLTPLPAVKAVILGQDPYHGPKQANGLCFS